MTMPEFYCGQLTIPGKRHTKTERDFLEKQHAKTEQDFVREDIHEFLKKKDEERKKLKESADGN